MASQKSAEILEEMTNLSVEVIQAIENRKLPRSVVDQTVRSVTSIGAIFAEAQDASSKRDFINKIYIAKKEATETKYWLTIIQKLTKDDSFIEPSEQVQRFIMMLQKIINSSKESNRS